MRQSELINVLAEIGVIFLLFNVGLETKPQAIFHVGTRASMVGVVGVLLPFAARSGDIAAARGEALL
ncbi:MAG: cation:proton antiporter [Acidobacteriota bacterium]